MTLLSSALSSIVCAPVASMSLLSISSLCNPFISILVVFSPVMFIVACTPVFFLSSDFTLTTLIASAGFLNAILGIICCTNFLGPMCPFALSCAKDRLIPVVALGIMIDPGPCLIFFSLSDCAIALFGMNVVSLSLCE